MKFQRILSICIFLFATFQASDSVSCPDGEILYGNAAMLSSRKECSKSCAAYYCPELYILTHYGCPEDAFEECASYREAIEFIKSKGKNDLEYFDGSMIYASGCGNEKDGTKCIAEKAVRFAEIFRKAERDGSKSPLWIGPNGSGSRNTNDKLNSVFCPDGRIYYGNATRLSSEKVCFGACAAYRCPATDQYTYFGCPEDAFEKCSAHTGAIEFIKSKGENDIEYYDLNMLMYVSGCGNKHIGTYCISEKTFNFLATMDKAFRRGYQSPLWNSPQKYVSTTHKPYPSSTHATNKPNHDSEDQNGLFRYFISKSESGSNNQNGALKWILAIGWMFMAAVWNY